MGEGAPRRSLRLALTETTFNENSQQRTPTKTSPDEMIIVQRGPRKKPLTWSPFDLDCRNDKKFDDKKKTPTRVKPRKSDINPKLRRRLILSPNKNSSYLGNVIAKKLKSLKNIKQELHANRNDKSNIDNEGVLERET